MTCTVEEVCQNVDFFLKTIGRYGFLLFKREPVSSVTQVPILLRSGPWRRQITTLDIDASCQVIRGTVAVRRLSEIEAGVGTILQNLAKKSIMIEENDIAFMIWVIDETNVGDEHKAAFASNLHCDLRQLLAGRDGLLRDYEPINLADPKAKPILQEMLVMGLPLEDKQRVLAKLLSAYASVMQIPIRLILPIHVRQVAAMYCQTLLHLYWGLGEDPPKKILDFSRDIATVTVSPREWGVFFPLQKPIGEDGTIMSLVLLALARSTYFVGDIREVSHTR